MLRKELKDSDIPHHSTLRNRIAEVVEKHFELLEKEMSVSFPRKEVIESARRVTGHPIPAEVHPRRPGDPAVLVASSEKAIRELGWKPRYAKLDDIMRTAWAWQQKRYKK